MKMNVELTLIAVLFLSLVNPVFAGMQSPNFKIPTSHFSGGSASMDSTEFKMQSSTGQSSPLMDADNPPYSSLHELYPGFWYTLAAEMANCDIAAFAAAFGSLSGDFNYSLMCDFDDDGDVDGMDLFLMPIAF